jgi:hypothetical protein
MLIKCSLLVLELLWSWSYGSWIYSYLCKQYLSPLTLWVWIPLGQGVLDTTSCDKFCQWLETGRLFSLGMLVSSTTKTDCHDITEILFKVALSIIIKHTNMCRTSIYYTQHVNHLFFTGFTHLNDHVLFIYIITFWIAVDRVILISTNYKILVPTITVLFDKQRWINSLCVNFS